jgi:heme exporter protein B
MFPALLGAMELTAGLVTGQPIDAEKSGFLKMMVGFDIIYTAVSLVLVETILVG